MSPIARERIPSLVSESRLAQSLPERVTDPAVIAAAAMLLRNTTTVALADDPTQDQLDGGRIKLAVTDTARVDLRSLEALYPELRGQVVVVEQRYSADELRAWKDEILLRMADAGIEGATGFSYSNQGVKIRVFASEVGIDVSQFLADIPTSAVVVEMPRAFINASDPAATHSPTLQKAGLQIGTTNGFCVWGLSGHTSSYAYIVTAGHCYTTAGNAISGWGIGIATQTLSPRRSSRRSQAPSFLPVCMTAPQIWTWRASRRVMRTTTVTTRTRTTAYR